MASKFVQEDAFPVIARLITTIHQGTSRYVTHEELVRALLADDMGRALVSRAREADEQTQSEEWWASNMIQWFSQRITAERSEYSTQFERTKIDNTWAYRPVARKEHN